MISVYKHFRRDFGGYGSYAAFYVTLGKMLFHEIPPRVVLAAAVVVIGSVPRKNRLHMGPYSGEKLSSICGMTDFRASKTLLDHSDFECVIVPSKSQRGNSNKKTVDICPECIYN